MVALLIALTAGFAPTLQPLCTRSAQLQRTALLPRMMEGAPAAEDTSEGVPSFVQTEMRGAAMALHTRGQAREGKAPERKQEQSPPVMWQPQRADYLQFLVDSREVYGCLEELVASTPELEPFRESGLERAAALDRDIEWFKSEGLEVPSVKSQGETYAAMLREMVAKGEFEAFVCHFYNFYFAHTAGGRMIGKRMADLLLDGRTLDFYTWQKGDVDKELLPGLRGKIDEMVAGWSREQKDAVLAQTADSFKYGGALLQHISAPK